MEMLELDKEELEMVELEDQGEAELEARLENTVGSRTREKRAMHLSWKGFADHGHADGCLGCRDIACGKKG